MLVRCSGVLSLNRCVSSVLRAVDILGLTVVLGVVSSEIQLRSTAKGSVSVRLPLVREAASKVDSLASIRMFAFLLVCIVDA